MSLYQIERIDLQIKAEVEAVTEYQACEKVGWDPKKCYISRHWPKNPPTDYSKIESILRPSNWR